MLSASSFDKDLYNQLKSTIEIQKQLSQLNKENLEEIGYHIIQEISGNEEKIYIFSHILLDFAEYRPKNIEIFSELFIYLQQMKSSSNKLDLLENFIVSFIHARTPPRSSSLFLIRTLFLRNAISFDLILKEINLIINPDTELNVYKYRQYDDDILDPDTYNNQEINLHRVINWFYPEMLSSYKGIIRLAKTSFKYFFPSQYKNKIQLEKMINSGYCLDTLAEIIRKDDIDSFIQIVSQSGENFDINQRKKSTIFERSSLLFHNPTLIQYSAFFNSIKIFKYLLLNNAKIESSSNDYYSLADYAVAGGSIEIIHILEQKGIELYNSIPISIKYYQNDIFQYILDNCSSNQKPSKITSKKIKHDDLNINDPLFYYYDFDENKYYKNVVKSYENKNMNQVDLDELNEGQHPSVYKINDHDKNIIFDYFDIDSVYKAIIESNNYLALFILFDHKMSINYGNKKTILHYAIRKGRFFLVKLLLSAKFIDPYIADSHNDIPLMYSILYNRKKIFLYMMKQPKVLNSLTNQDYIKMLFICNIGKCSKEIQVCLFSKWTIDLNQTHDLISLIDLNQTHDLLKILTFAPFDSFKNQLQQAIVHSFNVGRDDLMRIFVCRAIN